jgi:hypothetical protein
MRRIGLALESTADNTEIEYVFIAQMRDVSQLRNADSVTVIENWEFKSIEPVVRPGQIWGSVRARSYGGERFTITVKADENHNRKNGPSVVEEHEIPITKEMFLTFKKLSPYGSIVHRHTFPTGNGLTWEVDAYSDESGRFYNWCKIDLEVPNSRVPVPEFPIDLIRVINRDRTPEEAKVVKDLYDTKFNILRPNTIMPIKWIDQPS